MLTNKITVRISDILLTRLENEYIELNKQCEKNNIENYTFAEFIRLQLYKSLEKGEKNESN